MIEGFEASVIIEGLDVVSGMFVDDAKDELARMRDEALMKLFDENCVELNTDACFPLDGINQFLHIQPLRLKQIIFELVNNSIDELVSVDKKSRFVTLKKTRS